MQFREVETALAHLIGVHPGKRPRFQARLKQLQRMGFPEGINAGKTARATYTGGHLFQMAVVLELLQIGITPERAIRFSRTWWDMIRKGLLLARATHGMAIGIAFHPKDFGGLTSSSEIEEDESVAWRSDGATLFSVDANDYEDAQSTAYQILMSPRAVTLNLSKIYTDTSAGLELGGTSHSEVMSEMDLWQTQSDIFGRPLKIETNGNP